jgi:hypothetical protein
MGYDALAIGDKEISFGLNELEELLKAQRLVPVSNNIFVGGGEKTRFEPYRIVKVGRLNVGVTSTIGGATVVPRTLLEREGIELADPIAQSRETLQAMKKKKADVTVLLAHVGMDKAQEWVDSLQGYDVILVGHDGRKFDEPKKEKGIILAATSSRSNWLGEVNLTVDRGEIVNVTGRSFELKQDEGPYDMFLKELIWTKLELDEKGDRITKKPEGEAAQPAGATEQSQEAPAAEREFVASHVGGAKCAACHQDIDDQWTQTAHASAFKTIAESDDWEKPECWTCHVVGMGEKGGHPATTLEPALWNVQCESCHGMGTEHVRGAQRKKVDEATCRKCHTKEWSPDFDYGKYLKKVVHSSATRRSTG